jgi:hypothetical protein
MSPWERVNAWLKAWERLAGFIVATTVIVGALAAAIFFLRHHRVAAWIPVLIAFVLVVLVAVAYFVGRRSRVDASEPSSVRDLERSVASVEYQKRLLWDALESIQQAIATEEEWQLDELVERGVLGPARGLLVRDAQEDVRMAVLTPRDDPPTCWQMRWAAGHRPESVRSYNREIDRTMAGIAFRRGEFVESSNVREDPRIEPNPRESRPFSSLVSMPLRVGDDIVGAFTIVSTRAAAFSSTDVSFIKLIGAVLDVLLAAEHDAARWNE